MVIFKDNRVILEQCKAVLNIYNQKRLGPVYTSDRFLRSRDCCAINCPIGFNTHFIAEQSQKARKLASINRSYQKRIIVTTLT